MAGGGNRVEINISAKDDTEAAAAQAEARMKAIEAPTLKIQAQLEADHLAADANAAAAKARAKVQFEAALADIDQLEFETEKAKAEAEAYAELEFRTKIDSADLKAKADIAAAEAKAQIKFQAVIDKAGAGGFDDAIKKAADEEAGNFGKDFSDAMGGIPWFGIAIGAGVTLGLPVAAGAVSAGAAALMVGLAGYLDKNIPMVSSAWSNLGTTLANDAHSWAAPLAGPISDALNQISGMIDNESSVFASMFSGAGQDIEPLVSGLEGLVQNTLPGLNNMIQNSKPIMEALGSLLTNVGTGLSDMFNQIASDSPEISTDIRDFGQALLGALQTVGQLISVASKLGVVLMPVLEGLTEIIPTIGTAFDTEFNKAGGTMGMLIKDSEGLGLGLIRNKQNALDFGQALGNVTIPDQTDRNIADITASLHGAASSGDMQKMITDMQTFGDTTQTTQSRVSAFIDFLKGLGQGGQEAVNNFVAAATLDLDNLASSFKGVGGKAVDAQGGIMQFTQAGATLQQQMTTAQQDIGSVAESMHAMGDSSDDVTAKVGSLDQSLESKLMKTLGLTKQQADGLLTQFDLWPDQLLTHIDAADGASAAVAKVAGEIQGLNGMTATVHVNAAVSAAAQAAINAIAGRAAGGPITHHATGTPLSGFGMAMVNEMGPEIIQAPNGSRVIPNANVPSEIRSMGGGSGGGQLTMTFAGDTGNWLAQAVQNGIRTNQIQLNVDGQRVRVG